MNHFFWNIARADIHLGSDEPMEWYFVRDANRKIVVGPYRRGAAMDIAGKHNTVVMAMMETAAEAKAPQAKYEGMGA